MTKLVERLNNIIHHGEDFTAQENNQTISAAIVRIDKLEDALKNIIKGRVGNQIIMRADLYAEAQLKE